MVSAVAPVRMAEIVPDEAATWLRAIVPPLSVPPDTVTALAMVWLLRLSVPPVIVAGPEPIAVALPSVNVPAEIVVVPVKEVLVPERVVVPEPIWLKAPLPLRLLLRA